MVEKIAIALLTISQLYLFSRWFGQHRIKIFLLPGGITPKRQTPGAIGYDVHARCIVDPVEMDAQNPNLRKVLWDFLSPIANSNCQELEASIATDGKEFAYILKPGEKALIGIGFVTEFTFPLFYWVLPRSGLASRNFIQVTNAPGTIDPDYRGEAAVALHNFGKKDFHIYQGMRIAQIVFQKAIIPELTFVYNYNELSQTVRGAGGFGSTGV